MTNERNASFLHSIRRHSVRSVRLSLPAAIPELKRFRREKADRRINALVGLARERLQERFQNHSGAFAGDGHADLSAHGSFASAENEVVRERLQTGPFPVGEGAVFPLVIEVRSAAARPADRGGGFGRVQTAIEL